MSQPETVAAPAAVGLAAGGTLTQRMPSASGRLWLAVEMLAIFGLAPLAMDDVLHGSFVRTLLERFVPSGQIGLFIALMPILLGVLIYLLADRSFSLARELTRGFGWRAFFGIIAVFVIAGGAVAAYMQAIHPNLFLEFPTRRPETFKRIILLYPVISVIVQELVFRTFFFHRYGPLFGRQIALAILINGLLFGYAHIVMGNAFAVWSTAIVGCLFAYRYVATRSLWAVWLEHSLWGALVFTVGLGRWFFTGIGN
ncbi:MAG: CPBP family intramembrane glutamic endopeptidase [Hyphomicrobiaceae bacterium]